ncbi:MAG: hypothetical protein NE328_02670 [Lentisphaeraceae bacterium]|nr:hypothetical protein [Lentisphaeraceae bacterium]
MKIITHVLKLLAFILLTLVSSSCYTTHQLKIDESKAQLIPKEAAMGFLNKKAFRHGDYPTVFHEMSIVRKHVSGKGEYDFDLKYSGNKFQIQYVGWYPAVWMVIYEGDKKTHRGSIIYFATDDELDHEALGKKVGTALMSLGMKAFKE